MEYRIQSVEVVRYPVVRVTFADGLIAEVDLTCDIADDGTFSALRDPALFATVAMDPSGRSFGWRCDQPGFEIDVCADWARIRAETSVVEGLAENHRKRLTAAE